MHTVKLFEDLLLEPRHNCPGHTELNVHPPYKAGEVTPRDKRHGNLQTKGNYHWHLDHRYIDIPSIPIYFCPWCGIRLLMTNNARLSKCHS